MERHRRNCLFAAFSARALPGPLKNILQRLGDRGSRRIDLQMTPMVDVVFLLLIAGHTTLWVTFVNRSHALPLHCGTLRHFRHLHDVMIPLFPVLLVWQVGLTGPALLRGGSWSEVGPFWSATLALCGTGAGWLGFVILRGLLRRTPAVLASNHSRYFDVARELGYKPISRGPYRSLAVLPLNEQYRLEANEKTLLLPALPEEWEGLSILHLSDLHFQGTVAKEYFVRVCEIAAEQPADLVCFTGDLLDRQSLTEWLPETLGMLNGRYGNIFILGNHDWYQRPDETRDALVRLGWRDVSSKSLTVRIEGRTLEIGGDETPWMGAVPRFSLSSDLRLLLSHTPDHIGRSRREGIELMLAGHNHGGQVQLPLIGPVYSPSRHGCKYSGGTYWDPPTLLHVSRGVSGRHPLRWRCLPEVTRLVLKRPT
jgi:uncharacterized protein